MCPKSLTPRVPHSRVLLVQLVSELPAVLLINTLSLSGRSQLAKGPFVRTSGHTLLVVEGRREGLEDGPPPGAHSPLWSLLAPRTAGACLGLDRTQKYEGQREDHTAPRTVRPPARHFTTSTAFKAQGHLTYETVKFSQGHRADEQEGWRFGLYPRGSIRKPGTGQAPLQCLLDGPREWTEAQMLTGPSQACSH